MISISQPSEKQVAAIEKETSFPWAITHHHHNHRSHSNNRTQHNAPVNITKIILRSSFRKLTEDVNEAVFVFIITAAAAAAANLVVVVQRNNKGSCLLLLIYISLLKSLYSRGTCEQAKTCRDKQANWK